MIKVIVHWCKDAEFDWYSPCILIEQEDGKIPLPLPERMEKEEAEDMIDSIIRMCHRDYDEVIVEYVN